MKKKIALLLAIVLVLSAAMTGCGKKEVYKDDASVEYHIKWFAPGTKTQDHDMVFEEVSKYTKEKINATVYQTLLPNSEYKEGIQRLIFAGEPIDAMFAHSFPNLVSDGVYAPLEDLLEEHGKDIKATVPDYAWKAMTVDGKIYAFPPVKDYAVEHVFQYFDGIVNKYNLDFSNVKSLADLEPILQTVKDNEPGVSPLGVRGSGYGLSVFLPIERIGATTIAGFQTDNYDKVVNVYETQEFKEFFDLMRRWNQKGFFTSDAANSTKSITDVIKAHQVFLLTSESVPYFQEEKNLNEEEGWKTIFDGRLSQPVIATTSITASCIGISADSENPARTMKFFNMLYTDPYLLNTIVHGIEGTHYTVKDNTFVEYPDGITDAYKNNYYGNGAYQGNRWMLYRVPGEAADIWEKYDAFNKEAYVSPTLGFNFDNTTVMNELTAINNVQQEYIRSLMVGALDPATKLPEALEKFRKAGSEKLIAEVQSQYDAWRASNK